MPLYVYKKQHQDGEKIHTRLYTKLSQLGPTILITFGSLLIANVAWPIIQYQLFVSPSISKSQLVTPININKTAFYSPTNDSAKSNLNNPLPQAQSQEVDYTKVSNWFPAAQGGANSNSLIDHYRLSIPKVDIEDAIVQIGGEDLSNNLIQYPGTADPGGLGSPVIFGHSILRQFYNPSKDNPKRYMSIFSKIMTLKNGDEIIIDYDGITYTYIVQDKFEVKPTDVHILEQRYNNRQLKLVTCVPEGTYLRRGVLTAYLSNIGQPEPGAVRGSFNSLIQPLDPGQVEDNFSFPLGDSFATPTPQHTINLNN